MGKLSTLLFQEILILPLKFGKSLGANIDETKMFEGETIETIWKASHYYPISLLSTQRQVSLFFYSTKCKYLHTTRFTEEYTG